jgi:hypothetical protein
MRSMGAAIAVAAVVAMFGRGLAAADDAAVPGRDPEVSAFASIEPDTATVGDRLRLRVRVERGPDVDVAIPDIASAVAPLEVLDGASLPTVERDGRVIDERVFVLAAFETGLLAVPPIVLTYVGAAGDTGSVSTDSLFVTVVSVLPPEEEEQAPRDIKPPIELPRRVWPFVLAAAAALGGLLAYRYLRAWWRGRREPREAVVDEPIVPPRAAHLVAFERLEALRRADPVGSGQIEAFYVRVSDIVRHYVRDRFAVDAIDMTTEELRPRMELARIERGEVDWTTRYLARADLSKFARLHPNAERARGDFDEAWDFVERTRFREAEGEVEGGGAAVADADGGEPPPGRAPSPAEDGPPGREGAP